MMLKKIYEVDDIKRIASPLAKRYGVERMGLFGSYSRGVQEESSDIDFIISKGKLRGAVQFMQFVYELEEALGVHVDIITDKIDDAEILAEAKRDEVVIYEE